MRLRATTSPCHLAAILFLCLISLAHPRLARSAEQTPPTAATSFRTVSDETGRSVRLPVPVRRVVSLAPSLTESVYALGLEQLLVGDTDYCDYPEAAKRVHKVGGATNPSLEEIAALKPDVVLVIKSLNQPETVHQLERLGIASYASDPHTLDEIRASVRRLADVLGSPAAGQALDLSLRQQASELHQKLQNLPPARVLFVVWPDPLISIGRHTFIADALVHAGAVSVIDSSQDWPRISLEELVHLQPDVLVFAENHSQKVAQDLDALAKRPGWDLLDAVRNRRFAVISEAVNRPAPRLFAAVEELARQLHPDAFAEKSAASATKEKN